MWIEIGLSLVLYTVIVYGVGHLYQTWNLKRLRRRYDEKEDPGRRRTGTEGEPVIPGADKLSSDREPEIQELIESTRRELLQDGDCGLNYKYD